MAIRFIDLCSGIGGFHSGLMATGHYQCVGHAEIDPYASKAYEKTSTRKIKRDLAEKRHTKDKGLII